MQKLLILFLIFPATVSFGQRKIKEYVLHNTVPISTISPDSTNYDDLSIIGNSIGNAQIVMLGEQDHGDAATFLAKTRLVKYLHEKKGFNVLAFESDFFGLNNGWDNLDKSNLQIDSFIKNNILSLWAYCDACKDLLYEYIPQTQKSSVPIIVTGFDNQTVYTYSRNSLIEKLDSVLRKLEIPMTQLANYKSEVLPQLDTLVTKFGYQIPTQDFFKECGNTLNIIKEQVKSKISDESFWSLVIDNLIALNWEEYNFKKNKSIRDKQMALNLKWIIQSKYPNQKVIVWAANNHVAAYSDKNYTSMGQYLASDTSLSSKIYSIGFTSYEGKGGRLWEKKFTIGKPKNNSLESWISNSFQYAFIDFTNYNRSFPNANEEFNMRGWRYWTFKKQWNKIFDGIFYIKEMYPCTDIKTAAYIGLLQVGLKE
ncbi:MAG: erythromycin esterase family protein [Bacteroidetes bacterium]|nr:erythromycin esterase family protein [Bacteroidota bacterium]